MITDRIHTALTAARVRGIEPQNLYVGKKEWEEMDDLAQENGFYAQDPVKHGEQARTEFAGKKVFQVDADSHLHFG